MVWPFSRRKKETSLTGTVVTVKASENRFTVQCDDDGCEKLFLITPATRFEGAAMVQAGDHVVVYFKEKNLSLTEATRVVIDRPRPE